MNMIKFAKLVCNIACRHAINLSDDDITSIAGDVQQIIEDKPKANLYPLFDAIVAGKKIDAIKAYRELTGEGLLESKNAIERIGCEPVRAAP